MVGEIPALFPNTINPPNGRGCGKERREEVTYFVSAPAPIGSGFPLHYNLIDPVIPWGTWDAAGFNPLDVHRGAILYQRQDGIYDVIVTIGQRFGGEDAYLSPWDFFAETQVFGASRAMSPLLQWELLTPRHFDEELGEMVGSRMIFLHRLSYPYSWFQLRGNAPLTENCHVFKEHGHLSVTWEGTDNGWHPSGHARTEWEAEPTSCTFSLKHLAYVHHYNAESQRMTEQDNVFTVEMPSVAYEAVKPVFPRDQHLEEAQFFPGLFLAMPITGIEYARKANEEQKARLEHIGFQVDVLEY